jgi:manganese transport protein
MTPAIILLGIGFDPTKALVYSHVLLSFGIPFALIPLVLLTRNPAVMGTHVNRRLTSAVAIVLAAVITLLNVYLIYQQFWGRQ